MPSNIEKKGYSDCLTKNLGSSDSSPGVFGKHLPDKIFRTLRNRRPWLAFKVNFTFYNLIKYSFLIFYNT